MGKHRRSRALRNLDFGLLNAEYRRIRRRLELALVVLILIVAIGVVGYMIIGGREYGFIDALYMTIITLTTVGFGEIIDLSLNPAGRIFTIALLISGMGIFAYTMLTLATFVLEGHIRHIFSRRQMLRRISRMENHYIICGDSVVLWYITEELMKTGRSVVLVTPSQSFLDEAGERLGDVPGIVGDPTDDHVLLGAELLLAAGIVFCMENDKDNMLGVLTARRLARDIRIIASTELPETIAKLKAAGADSVVSPSHIGGLRMASELIRPAAVTFLDQMLRVGGGSLRVEEVVVPANSTRIGQSLASLEIDRESAVLLAVSRKGERESEFKPDPSLILEAGMTFIVMSDVEGRTRFEDRLRT